MAVCANNIALRYLVEDGLPAAPADACGDGKLLVTEVIKLENDRIGLAAVGARMTPEELNEKGRALGDEHVFSTRRRRDVALPICDVVRSFVGSSGGAAIRVELTEGAPVPGKLRCGLQLAAAAAALAVAGTGHEHMFAYNADGSGDSLRRRLGAVESLTKRRGVAQSGSAPGWGPGGRRFKSCLPDQKEPANQDFSSRGTLLWRGPGGRRLKWHLDRPRKSLHSAGFR